MVRIRPGKRVEPFVQAALAAVVLIAWCDPAFAGRSAQLEIGFDGTDNITRAILDGDRESERFAFLAAEGDWHLQPATSHTVTLFGTVRHSEATETDALTHTALGAGFRWRGKTRLGREAPRWIGSLHAEFQDHQSALREGWVTEGRFGYARPFGTGWDLALEAVGISRNADSDAFDQDSLGLDFHTRRTIGRWDVDAGYRYRDGDVTAVATPAAVDPRTIPVLDASTARAPDDAFAGRIAYRLDSETHAVDLGASLLVTRSSSLEIRLSHEWTDTAAGVDYRTGFLTLAWLKAF